MNRCFVSPTASRDLDAIGDYFVGSTLYIKKNPQLCEGFAMPGTRLELVTRGFSVHCSTN